MSISNYAEDKILDAVGNNVSFAVASVYVKLHTGDPGEAGTNNAAGETTRKLASFSAASGGSMVTDADLAWTSVSTAETYSHISLWDASSGGNCLWVGALTASKTVAVGDNFTIPAGSLTLSLE